MKILTTLFIMLLLTSCGKLLDTQEVSEPRPDFVDDITFKPYKDRFEYTVQQQTGDNSFSIGDIPITFSDTNLMDNPNVIGLCTTYTDGKRAIEVKRSFWDNASVTSRAVLIDHELGHCRLNREHKDELYRGYKVSVMHSSLVNQVDYYDMKIFYKYEMVTGDSRSMKDYIDNLF